MILSLRQRHRRVFAVLVALLPVAFAIGIAARKPIPHGAVPSLWAALRDSETEVWNRSDLFPKMPVNVRLLRGPMQSFYAVEFLLSREFTKPDLLVYWVADTPSIADKLPDNARLLGTFNAALPLQLPTDVTSGTGVLVLYSLADSEIVDASKPTRLGDSTN